ncbi:MAG: polynucleotide adenylyltransferase PcnB [Proteobacteria bacterium]|nr:polynucleotide adenylyltransferase PcnB [Pseudomonadota bacterium]
MPKLDRSAIDPDADRVVRKLTRAGHKAYLVGGCVRDLLVGRKPKDFDVATSATPNEIKATFRNSRIIGRRFRLAHVVFGSKIIETATFRANPREEDAHDDSLLIRRDNVFGNETEDARRRDFTINGLFYDVEKEVVIDHVGGLADLDAKLVRTIGDPEVRFQEDPVRMLRAIKFAARLDFEFETVTKRALLRWRGEISKCAPPRLLEEMHRLMRGGAARRSFELMVETGSLAVLSPYLAGLLEGAGAPTTANPTTAAGGVAPHAVVARIDYDEDDPAERDVDDPIEPEDDSGEDEEAIAAVLDPEELQWHRVWADEPIVPLPIAAPVRLSFLPSGHDLVKRRQLAWDTLAQLDRVIAEGRDPSNAVAFGVVLTPFVPDELRGGELHAAIDELANPMIVQLHVTRRDSERLRYLLVAQRKLAAAKKRGVQAELGGGREAIDDALLMHELLEVAAGREVTPTEVIAPQEGREDGPAAGEGEAEGEKRRRRRRGGRRRA